MKRQRNLVQQIKEQVLNGKVKETFKSSDFDFLSRSTSFISKHAVGNGTYTEYFVRVGIGQYKLK